MENLIQNFSIKSVTDFFFSKISSFQKISENLDHIFVENDFAQFSLLQKVGEATFNDASDLIVFTCKFQGVLSERSSKKRQFEIAKKVLKEDFKDGAIFIFYDENNCFRFSFIRKNYGNKEQKFTNWKRYTYFVDPTKSYKTFKNRINGCNFSSLEDIQEAFNVEKLNKKFYEEIATAFYSLIGGKVSINKKEVSFNSCLQLPSTPVENRKVYQEFAVRLIGRTIFCWFLKNKKSDSGVPLIPEEWLSSNMVASVNNDQHNYYHSILEKLFFLVLNKKHEDRKPYVLPNNHEFVPFLNGGLFEAQDDDFFPKDSKGIHSQNFALNIPNQWFKDFFETLEQYNFTIDENSINDFEVSIDPEMLGTIFENLLAEIDPDTEKSARKSTGSFYTPREIVDYMVEQSLLQYIKTKTSPNPSEGRELELQKFEENLEVLLKDDTENPFDEKQTITILEALSEVKILDPACGSGAFPMGVLHKIIGLLKKLDKNAVWWKAKQLEKIDNALVRKTMETKLNQANSDYIRKLGVIQHSIYGVDIQPIAAEISKLRSFLSLIIDENIDDNHPEGNRGIEPLPNLEFKFVTANTLIGLEAEKQQTAFDFGETEELQNQLQKLRNNYLQATPTDKQKLKTDFEKLQTQIYKNELKAGGQNKRAQQLAAWKPFSNDSSTWFDPDWMFGVEKFDVVIGNPPYGFRTVLTSKDKEYFRKELKIEFASGDSAELFTKISFDKFVGKDGILTFIIPKKSLYGDAWESTRVNYWKKFNLQFILDTGKSFENVLLEASVFGLSKNENNSLVKLAFLEKNKGVKEFDSVAIDKIFVDSNTCQIYKVLFPEIIFVKIMSKTNKDYYIKGKLGLAIGTDFYSDTKKDYKLLKGIDIKKFELKGHRYLNNQEKLNWKNANEFLKPKLLCQRMVAHIEKPYPTLKITACYDEEGILITNTLMSFELSKNLEEKFLLAYLNSKFLSWYAYNFVYSRAIRGMDFYNFYIQQLPIPVISINEQNNFVNLTNQILSNKKDNIDTTDLEVKIDLMVYKLYELTYDEVLVVEPEFSLSKQEYDNFKIES